MHQLSLWCSVCHPPCVSFLLWSFLHLLFDSISSRKCFQAISVWKVLLCPLPRHTKSGGVSTSLWAPRRPTTVPGSCSCPINSAWQWVKASEQAPQVGTAGPCFTLGKAQSPLLRLTQLWVLDFCHCLSWTLSKKQKQKQNRTTKQTNQQAMPWAGFIICSRRRTLAASQHPEEDTDAPVDVPAVRRVLLPSPLGSRFPALLKWVSHCLVVSIPWGIPSFSTPSSKGYFFPIHNSLLRRAIHMCLSISLPPRAGLPKCCYYWRALCNALLILVPGPAIVLWVRICPLVQQGGIDRAAH